MNQSKIFIGLILFFIAIAGFATYKATRSEASHVLTPTRLIDEKTDHPRIRIGGKVANEGIEYLTSPKIELRFFVTDRDHPENKVPVVYKGLKPDMFTGGRDVLIDGDYLGGTIEASQLLTQCPSKYEPVVPGANNADKVSE